MRRHWLKICALLTVSILCTACGPSLTHEGELTETVEPRNINACKHIGNSRITLPKSTLSKNPGKQARALLIEARNLAGKIGANTVVPFGEVQDKQQIFKFYLCEPDE